MNLTISLLRVLRIQRAYTDLYNFKWQVGEVMFYVLFFMNYISQHIYTHKPKHLTAIDVCYTSKTVTAISMKLP